MRAQRLPDTTELLLARIATDIGLGSPVTLRQQFQQAYRSSLSNYRRSFCAMQD